MRSAFVFLLLCAVGRADTLSDLKLTLAAPPPDTAIAATVRVEISRLASDAGPREPRTLEFSIADGPEGFRIGWPRNQLTEAMRRPAGETDTRSARRSHREAVGSLSAVDLFEYLNVVDPLGEVLGQAELVSEKPDTRNGRPARRVALKLNPPLSTQERKYIKELTAEATLWLDEDGWPLAAETRMHAKGRALLVITFEQSEEETYEFARVAGRLVTVQHEKMSRGSGGGESGGRKIVTRLEFNEGSTVVAKR